MGAGGQGGPLIDKEDLEAKVSARYHRPPKRVGDDYDIQDTVLGTGMNGSVFMANRKDQEGVVCAVKPLNLNDIKKNVRVDLQHEVEIFLSMDHPHVARLVDVYEDTDENKLNLVMECCEGGELLGRVMKQKKYTETDAGHAIWQVLLATNYIHTRGIVHRDVKLENFLYERQDNDHLKLIDFGFSKVTAGDKALKNKAGGTLQYAAPEVFDESFTTQCDLWSVGVVAFILLLGYMPFTGQTIRTQIMKADYLKKPVRWKLISDNAQNFIESLLVADPSKRLTAVQALKHPFIANRDQTGRRYVTPLATLDGDASAKLNVTDDILDALVHFANASKFRRAILSLISWCLTSEERSEVRDAFIELDVKREGVIPMSELRLILTNRFKYGDKQAGQIVDNLANKEGDEELHYSDFLGAMVEHHIKLHEGHFLSLFRRFDKDNSGHITQENLTEVLGTRFGKKEIFTIVHAVDPTGNGHISYPDFLVYLETDEQGRDTTGRSSCAAGEYELKQKSTLHDLVGVTVSDEKKAQMETKFKGIVADDAASSKKSRACAVL